MDFVEADPVINSASMGGGLSTSMDVSVLPCDGSTVYVRFWYNSGAMELSTITVVYSYTSYPDTGGGIA